MLPRPATNPLPSFLAAALLLVPGCSDKPEETGRAGAPDEPRKPRFSLLWRKNSTDKEDGFSASPAVSADKIFLASNNGTIAALSAADGGIVWRSRPASGFSATPVAGGGRIFIGSLDGTFLALDSKTGETLWKADVGAKIAGSAAVVESKDATVVVFGAYDRTLHCLNAANGAKRWSFKTKGFINGRPVAVGGSIVFGGCDGHLRRLDATTGKVIWSFDAGSYIPGSPAVSGDRVFVATHGGKVFAVSLDTGKKLWEFSDDESSPAFFAAPTAGEGLPLMVPSDDGALYALSQKTGRLLWKIKLPGVANAPPLVLDKRHAATTDDSGALTLISLNDGSTLAEKNLGEPFENSPALADGTIFAASEEGSIFAITADAGESASTR